ncbi:MAG: sugar phosphate nucleotidyltransferase [Vulcanimicrobiota bacterium]
MELLSIKNDVTLKEALKKLDKSAQKVLLIVDDFNRLIGALTDGDIRRFLLEGNDLENNISTVYNKKPIFLRENGFTSEMIREIFIRNKVELLPIVNEKNMLVDYITWDKAFSQQELNDRKYGRIDIPVVIMAGGKGTRYEPLSRIIPKPLVPLGDKTLIETIIDEFRKFAVKKFFFTLNYKGDMIKAYFSCIERDYNIEYLEEQNFLGTAGSLKLLSGVINEMFIVSNCDVLVRADYEDVMKFHKSNNSMLTVLSSIQHYKIPYGVISFAEKGVVTDIIEKPEHTFIVNTGVYILNREVLEYIPDEQALDMPDLIGILIENRKPVHTYPVNENDYVDIGQLEEYKHAIKKLRLD